LTLGIAKQTLQDLQRGDGTVSLSIAFAVLADLGIELQYLVDSVGGANGT